MNEIRTELGQKPYVAVTGLSDIPDKLLKLAVPNPDEVGIEAHAYALTQLSIFEDRHHTRAKESRTLRTYRSNRSPPQLRLSKLPSPPPHRHRLPPKPTIRRHEAARRPNTNVALLTTAMTPS